MHGRGKGDHKEKRLTGREVIRDVSELELGVSRGEEEGGGLSVRGRERGSVVEGRERLSLGLPSSV